MMKLKQYPEYKTCNYPNVDNIPSHWNFDRNKYIFNISKEVVGDTASQHDLLSLTLRGIIKRDLENPTGKFPAEFNTYQKVKPNDMVFCLFDIDETPRTVGISSLEGMITGAYTVVKCKPNVNPQFLYYYYLALDNHKSLKPFYTGLRKVIKPDIFLRIRTPYPTKSEQDQIVKYLDFKSAKITKFIRNKRRLIQLLKEQKQAIINQAVTRGINSNVKMKPSGVDWLGDVPEHWEMKKLRTILKPVSERNKPDLPLLSVVREKGIIVRNVDDFEENHNFIPDDLTNYKVVKIGQFAMNKMKAWQGSYGMSKYTGIVSPAYFVFNVSKSISNDFFHVAIRSKAYVPFFNRASDGVRIGQWDLSITRMKEIPFFIPSDEEQKEIVKYIEEETELIDKTVVQIENEIQLIREYRTRLISDVVTGKVDVRDIKVEDVTYEEITDDLDSSEDEQELDDSVEEVFDGE
jgi:type I restriction enzyme, S subunit